MHCLGCEARQISEALASLITTTMYVITQVEVKSGRLLKAVIKWYKVKLLLFYFHSGSIKMPMLFHWCLR